MADREGDSAAPKSSGKVLSEVWGCRPVSPATWEAKAGRSAWTPERIWEVLAGECRQLLVYRVVLLYSGKAMQLQERERSTLEW